jgi:hypothetical protein
MTAKTAYSPETNAVTVAPTPATAKFRLTSKSGPPQTPMTSARATRAAIGGGELAAPRSARAPATRPTTTMMASSTAAVIARQNAPPTGVNDCSRKTVATFEVPNRMAAPVAVTEPIRLGLTL